MDILKNKKIIIFGAGNTAKNITTYITENYKNIICIIDNDSRKWGNNVNGYSIQSPECIKDYRNDENVIIVIATFLVHKEMEKQLNDLGWDMEHVMFAINQIPFFQSLEFRAYLRNVDLHNPLPTILNIELSGYCNCKCVYCPYHGEFDLKSGHKGFMSWETLDAVIGWVKRIPSINTVDTTGAGEIFLNKDWYEMLEKLIDNTSIDYIIMYTNGMLLTEDNVKKISLLNAKKIQLTISIDGKTPKENDSYRIGSKYEVIRKNIYAAKQFFGSEGKVEFRITNCYPTTLKDIEESDYKLVVEQKEIPQFLQKDFNGIELISYKTLHFEEGEIGKFKAVEVEWPENEKTDCLALFCRLAIDCEGNLLRCSCGKHSIEGIGNVFSDDILDLWYNDEQMQRVRRTFIDELLEEDFCTGCTGKRKGKHYVLIEK